MNPDTGKIHELTTDLEGVERIAKGEEVSDLEDALARARSAELDRAADNEPLPGTKVPENWPRFSIGDRVGPIKGWWFEITDVDVVTQELLVRPLEPVRSKRTRTRKTRNRRRGRRGRG
jgi:hypothetical protein